jgi:1-acyl-sn-glycerol-3-phosphate acyltransferase
MALVKVPSLGDSTPCRGNSLTAAAGRIFLHMSGWRFEGAIPDVAKAVLIVAPHTSNIDFFVGVAAMFALGLRVVFLGKHTLFVWPLGPIMRWLGGVPVDRRATSGVVEETVALFDSTDRMILVLSPEGTRRAVDKWKTGFYYVALEAGVPVVPVALDYGRRTLWIGDLFEPTGDLAADLEVLEEFFIGAEGCKGG